MQGSVEFGSLILSGADDLSLSGQLASANFQKFRPVFEYSRQGIGSQEIEIINSPLQLHGLIWQVLEAVFNRQPRLSLSLPADAQCTAVILKPSLSLPGLRMKLLLKQAAGGQAQLPQQLRRATLAFNNKMFSLQAGLFQRQFRQFHLLCTDPGCRVKLNTITILAPVAPDMQLA